MLEGLASTLRPRLRKKLTFHVSREELPYARALLPRFRKYFSYVSAREGGGYVTITIYKRTPVTYRLLTLRPGWHERADEVVGLVFRSWQQLRRERGFYGYT